MCVCHRRGALYAIAWWWPVTALVTHAIVFVCSAAGCQVTPQITSFERQTLILFGEISATPLITARFTQNTHWTNLLKLDTFKFCFWCDHAWSVLCWCIINNTFKRPFKIIYWFSCVCWMWMWGNSAVKIVKKYNEAFHIKHFLNILLSVKVVKRFLSSSYQIAKICKGMKKRLQINM